jgi:hypothetical protein
LSLGANPLTATAHLLCCERNLASDLIHVLLEVLVEVLEHEREFLVGVDDIVKSADEISKPRTDQGRGSLAERPPA